MGLILSKKLTHPTPGGHMGVFRGQKNQKSGKWHELPRKHIFVISPGGGEEVLEVNILKVREISWTAQKINIF